MNLFGIKEYPENNEFVGMMSYPRTVVLTSRSELDSRTKRPERTLQVRVRGGIQLGPEVA